MVRRPCQPDVIRRTTVVLALLLAAACGDDDDDDGTSTRAVTNESTASDATLSTTSGSAGPASGSSSASGSQTQPECQADTGEDAGSVAVVESEEVTLDCDVASGGETIRQGSVIRTNSEGAGGLDLQSGRCVLYPLVAIQVQPQDGITVAVLAGSEGQLGGSCGVIKLIDGTLITPRELTSLFVDGRQDGGVNLVVTGGFATLDGGLTECRSIVGPREVVSVGADSSVTRTALREGAVGDLAPILQDAGTDLSEPTFSLRDVVADVLDSGDAALSVDDRLIEDRDELPSGVDRFLLGDRNVELVDPTDVAQAAPDEPEATAATTGTSGSEDTAPAPTEAPEPPPQPELVHVPILADAEGSLWAAELVPDGPALNDLRVSLEIAVMSGAYGSAYEREFGALPDYVTMRPELLDGLPSC